MVSASEIPCIAASMTNSDRNDFADTQRIHPRVTDLQARSAERLRRVRLVIAWYSTPA
jgi:hypothetical protein